MSVSKPRWMADEPMQGLCSPSLTLNRHANPTRWRDPPPPAAHQAVVVVVVAYPFLPSPSPSPSQCPPNHHHGVELHPPRDHPPPPPAVQPPPPNRHPLHHRRHHMSSSPSATATGGTSTASRTPPSPPRPATPPSPRPPQSPTSSTTSGSPATPSFSPSTSAPSSPSTPPPTPPPHGNLHPTDASPSALSNPAGLWTRRILAIPRVKPNYTTPHHTPPPASHSLTRTEHKSDITRLQALRSAPRLRRGIPRPRRHPLRDISPLRTGGFGRVGVAERDVEYLLNGVMLSAKHSAFIEIYCEACNMVFTGEWDRASVVYVVDQTDLAVRVAAVAGAVLRERGGRLRRLVGGCGMGIGCVGFCWGGRGRRVGMGGRGGWGRWGRCLGGGRVGMRWLG